MQKQTEKTRKQRRGRALKVVDGFGLNYRVGNAVESLLRIVPEATADEQRIALQKAVFHLGRELDRISESN